MRKYGTAKRNPDPKWPCEQPIIVVPPGSNAAAVGRVNESVRAVAGSMTDLRLQGNDMPNLRQEGVVDIDFRQSNTKDGTSADFRENNMPIMGYMEQGARNNQMQSMGNNITNCGMNSASSYLCQRIGNYAKVEFLFGENTHIEKTGILDSVGKDFIVLTEAGTGTQVLCSVKNIKFINIYNVNNG